ncbi:MAG: hypothetical protein PF518_04050, partial [Spirochaetaceae bacterium]|nr:hypothetical protein [Spirochaetaceae bacterium]
MSRSSELRPSGTTHWQAVSKAYEQPLLSLSNKNKKTKVFLAFDLLIKVVFNKNMTLSLRNTLIKVSLFISISLFLIYTVSIIYLHTVDIFSIEKLISLLLLQNSFNSESINNSIFWTISTASIILIFSIITSFLLFHYFKKKISPEIFFFILFILCLSLQTIRLFQFQFLVLN